MREDTFQASVQLRINLDVCLQKVREPSSPRSDVVRMRLLRRLVLYPLQYVRIARGHPLTRLTPLYVTFQLVVFRFPTSPSRSWSSMVACSNPSLAFSNCSWETLSAPPYSVPTGPSTLAVSRLHGNDTQIASQHNIPLATDAGLYLPQLGVVNAYVLADGSLSPEFNQAVGIFLIAWMIVTCLFILGMSLLRPFPSLHQLTDRIHRRTKIFRGGAIHSGLHCVVSHVPCDLAIHRSA